MKKYFKTIFFDCLEKLQNIFCQKKISSELGSGLIETCISITLLSTVIIASSFILTTSISKTKKQQVAVALTEITQDKIEELSSIMPNLLNNLDYDEVEENIRKAEFPNLQFERTTDVSVSNSIITLTVTTSCNHHAYAVSQTLTKTIFNS